MLKIELTPQQRMGLCYLISRQTACSIHGRAYQYPVDTNDDHYAQFFGEVYLRIGDNRIAVRISDEELMSIAQQMVDRMSSDVAELTAALAELDTIDPEEAP